MSILLVLYLFLFIAFSILDYINLQRASKELFLFLSYILMIFVIIFRFGVPDYDSYIRIFNDVPLIAGKGSYIDIHGEIGYLYLNSIIKSIGGTPIVLFGIIGAGSVLLAFSFYKKYTKYYLVALLIYFSHVFLLREMIQIRAGFAVCIVMFAIPFIYERKLLPTLLIISLASLFHSISWLFLLVYFLYPYLISTKNQVLALSIGILLGLVFTLGLLEKILVMLGAPALVLSYILDEQYNFSLGLLNPVLIKHLIVLGILYINREFLEGRIRYFNVLLVCYVLAAFWLSAFNSFAIFSARIATMFSNVEHILIPSLLLITKYKRVIFLSIIFYALISFFSKWDMIKNWTFSFSC